MKKSKLIETEDRKSVVVQFKIQIGGAMSGIMCGRRWL